jgi:hypothetical protein
VPIAVEHLQRSQDSELHPEASTGRL